MSAKQDKATTERHARTLRELLHHPDNKTCADCKRNDPRWASWNLGVFLCIRCSGIHRSMGTHISKVKSVDLDIWTPEQMASIQKWGNRRANLYWEAYKRPGHIPRDSDVDSFIRTKYESRRWIRDKECPDDPSVLDADAPLPATAASSQAVPPAQVSSSTHTSRASVSSPNATRATHPHKLLSTAVAASREGAGSPPSAITSPGLPQLLPQVAPQQPSPSAAVDLFALDFHEPVSTSPSTTQPEQPKKDVKAEILSLFSTAHPAAHTQQNASGGLGGGVGMSSPAAQAQNQSGGLGTLGGMGGMGAVAQTDPWGGFEQQTSMMGNTGVGMWGTSSGWNPTPAAAPLVPSSIWTTPAAAGQQNMFSMSDVWSMSTAGANGSMTATAAEAQKNQDAFDDIWDGFK